MSIPAKLGKYEIRRELGQGAMGIVYEGYDALIDRRVALKTVKTANLERVQVKELLMRFRREAQAAGRLSHPHIVAIYEYGEELNDDPNSNDAGTAYIAMEFIEGRELKDHFDADERFSLPEIQRIMGELLDALDYSHRHGVVHRDIKPANIILLKDGTVKVADFGIARLESSNLTQVGAVMGTPSYMSPEQFMGQTVDGRSDLFSAGIVLYQFLTGERPFTGAYTTIMHKVLNEQPPLPSLLNVQVPKQFDGVIRKALAKRPDERFQSAAEFKRALLAVGGTSDTDATVVPAGDNDATLTGGEATLPGAPQADPLPSAETTRLGSASRSKAAIAVVASVAIIGIGLAGYLFVGLRGDKSPAAPTIAGVAAEGTTPVAASSRNDNGLMVISAVGLGDPADPRFKQDQGALFEQVREDARRQLVEKATALYVEQASLAKNYAVLRDKLLPRSGEFIQTVLDEQQPTLGKDGLMSVSMRATVKVRDVRKSLNQMSQEERVEFIRNNGDPKISVAISAHSAAVDPNGPAKPSPIAENILKERIRSFGFRTVSDDAAKQADFAIEGEVKFKKLSATLPASGLTIEKFVLTSWTVKAVDRKTGEEIYYNTKVPEKQSWNSEELAIQDVGRLIGGEFSKDFFLAHFDFTAQHARLSISGLPAGTVPPLLIEINALRSVLNATLARQDGRQALIDADLSGGQDALGDLVQGGIVRPLNRKFGKTCLSLMGVAGDEVRLGFDVSCADAGTLGKLETLPPAALIDAPSARREDVIKSLDLRRRISI